MKNLVRNGFLLLGIVSLISGCGSQPTVTEVHTTLNTDTSISNINNFADNTQPDLVIPTADSNNLKGNYDDIFNHEINTQSATSASLVIKGYEFTLNSSSFCTFFEGVGPAILVGQQLQYKLVVQDRTFDEIKNMDVTAKTIAAGGTITEEPQTITEDGLEYIYFAYSLDGEKGVAINMPGPDPNHAIGVQIAVVDESVSTKDAIRAALPVARTATITDKPDTTQEEIDKQYHGLINRGGVRIDEATINFDNYTYSFTVPEGYTQTCDSTDEDMCLQIYKSSDSEATLYFTFKNSSSDEKIYIENMIQFNICEQVGDIKVYNNNFTYALTHYPDYDTYGIMAAKIIDDKYLYTVEIESSSNIAADDVAGFFTTDKAVTKEDNFILGPHTEIKHDQMYKGEVKTNADALKMIAQYGDMQRERYNNPEVTKIELSLQSKYDIAAVNLGEMDIETAKDVEKAVTYMFDTYPMLKGSLNTISLANLTNHETNFMAVTQTVDFIVQDENGVEWPKTVRHEILLNANKWLDRNSLLSTCKDNVDSGYWFKNVKDPSKIIVHELGHQLLNVLRAKEYGFVENGIYMPCQLREQNKEEYLAYYWSGTALNQELETKLIQDAYKEWCTTGNKGSEEDFRKSISEYANGIQYDGGISYHETFAEAVADLYCNGNNASEASKLIVNQINK